MTLCLIDEPSAKRRPLVTDAMHLHRSHSLNPNVGTLEGMCDEARTPFDRLTDPPPLARFGSITQT